MFGRNVSRHSWEAIGNYKYTISRREIEKTALGLNLKAVAFKGINDHWIPKAGEEKISNNGPIKKIIVDKIKRQDFFCKYKLTDYALLTAVIFKEMPSKELLDNLEEIGYEVIFLPTNPYIYVFNK